MGGGRPVNYELTDEEREILERFERGELRRSSDADRELEIALQAARDTLNDLDKAAELELHSR